MDRYILFLTLAVFTIVAISSCTCLSDMKPGPPDKVVKIRTKNLHGKNPSIEPPWEHLEYGTDQQIIWEIDNPELNFTVMFKKNETPFDKHEFNKNANKSGRAEHDPGEKEKFYKYSIKVDGFDLIDPGIIIWRRN